jgi:hypothetical protein
MWGKTMLDLKTVIKNKLDSSPSLADELVSLTTIRNKTRLYRYLQSPDCEIDCFESLLTMVRQVCPEQEYEVMDAYIRTLDPNQVLARHSLEYANCNRLDNLYYFMLDKLSTMGKHRESQEWVRLHELEDQRHKGEISNVDFPKILNSIKFKSPEMKVYSKIVLLYYYYDLRDYQRLKDASSVIEKQIRKLKSPFIRTSFTLRLAMAMTAVSYHFGELEKIRLYGQVILDQPGQNRLKSMVHLYFGNSYIYSNYQRSLYHLLKAEELSGKEFFFKQLKRSRNFLANYWGETPPYLDFSSKEIPDIHEVVFHHIKSGRMIEALNLLKSTDWESLTNNQKGFHMFYKGIAVNDRNFLFESVQYFTQAEEKYYIYLPLLELERIGEDPEIVRALRLK